MTDGVSPRCRIARSATDRAQSDNQEDDSAVVMKPSIQESRIHVSSELSNHKDAKTILCHRK